MSAWSDYRHGYITEDKYKAAVNREAYEDEVREREKDEQSDEDDSLCTMQA